MKTLLILSALLLFSSCGEGEPGASCNNSKQVNSVWISDDYGTTYNMTLLSPYSTTRVLFGPGPCNDSRGDFTIYWNESAKRFGFSNCSDTIVLDAASYTISCNIMSITYDSDGSVETYR